MNQNNCDTSSDQYCKKSSNPNGNVTLVTDSSSVPKKGKVVIDFYATWCEPCKKLGPHFIELSNNYPNITFLKADTDKAEELASEYEVSALPTILFIKDGDVISIIKGFNLDKIKSELEELNNS
jgi:thioredoxin 1